MYILIKAILMLREDQIVSRTKFKAAFKCDRCEAITSKDYYSAIKSRTGNLCIPCSNILSTCGMDLTLLREVLDYNQTTGELVFKIDQKMGVKGAVATYAHNEGYKSILIGGKEFLAHRVIWFMMLGYWPNQIDHINHNRQDNSWSNLRDVLHRDNQMNMGKRINNTSGHTGVRILPSGRFCSYIMVNRKQVSLGTFDELSCAVAARKRAQDEYGFHVNHGK